MDKQAKAYLPTMASNARHQLIAYEPWSLWIDGQKLIKNVPECLYDQAPLPKAQTFWSNKKSLNTNIMQYIDWTVIKRARKMSNQYINRFISKHTVGMCGVGKFLVQWKESDDPSCPRCGAFEDSSHICHCNGKGADTVWQFGYTNNTPILILRMLSLLTFTHGETLPLQQHLPE